jgi:hypothetical protein
MLGMEEQTVPDLYRLAFMPGCFRCPQCGFTLSKTCINVNLEIIGTREQDREIEACPNDGAMMVHVTYKEQLEVYAERLKQEFDRFDAHTKAVADFLNDLWSIMIDPLADGTRSVADTMAGLREAALQYRESVSRAIQSLGGEPLSFPAALQPITACEPTKPRTFDYQIGGL